MTDVHEQYPKLAAAYRDLTDALDAAIGAAGRADWTPPGQEFCDELAMRLRYHADPQLAALGRRIEAIDHEGSAA